MKPFIFDQEYRVAFLPSFYFDHEGIFVLIVMNEHLSFLLLVGSIERGNIFAIEAEEKLFSSIELDVELYLFEKIGIGNDVAVVEGLGEGRDGFLWELLKEFLVDEVECSLAVSTLYVDAILVNIISGKATLIEVFYHL